MSYVTARNSHQRCSIEKAILKNFTIFAGKHLCWSHFLTKLQAQNTYFEEHLRAAVSVAAALKRKNLRSRYFYSKFTKISRSQIFSCEYCKIFWNSLFIECVWTFGSRRFFSLHYLH